MAFTIENGVLTKYIPEDGETEIVIPKGVTVIGNIPQNGFGGTIIERLLHWNGIKKPEVFRGCTHLTRVVLPEGVTMTGDRSFRDCTGLTAAVLPESLRIIGFGTFENCGSLTEIKIPKGVTCIEASAFNGCRSLRHAEIPAGVTAIDYWVFEGCENLTEIVIPEGVTSIGFSAFRGCRKLASIRIPESVTKFGGCIFEGTPWLEQHPDDLVIVNHVLITYKGQDTVLRIPEGVTDIVEGAVNDCSHLEHIIIPDSVTGIGKAAFKKSSGLERFTLYGITFRPRRMKPNDLYDAMEMLRNLDFSVDLPENVKFAAIVGFYLKTNNVQAENYLRNNAIAVFRFLMDSGNENVIYRLLEHGGVLTAESMDAVLKCAIEKGTAELSAAFLHYKSEVLGYSDPAESFKL